MMRTAHALMVLGGLLLAPVPAAAQSPLRIRGPWLSMGVGAGSGRTTCASCELDERQLGGAARLGFGYTFSPRVRIAAEMNGWIASSQRLESHIGSLEATVHLFPFSSAGIYLSAGAGFSRSRVLLRRNGATPDEASVAGLGFSGGMGYDVGVGRAFSVQPFVTYHHAPTGALRLNGYDSGMPVGHSVIAGGLALAWHIPQRW